MEGGRKRSRVDKVKQGTKEEGKEGENEAGQKKEEKLGPSLLY